MFQKNNLKIDKNNNACSSHLVTVQGAGMQFACREDEFVLAAMLRARCGPVGHGCCGGGCGVCKMKVLAGDFEKVKKMSRAHVSEQEEKDGVVLLCCIQPRTDMTILRV